MEFDVDCCLQDVTVGNPLPSPDATSRADIKLLSQLQSQPKSFQPDATARSALLTAARGANATSSNASPRGMGFEYQNSVVHTDVMPSQVLGWPPKNVSLAPTPSPLTDQPGANGAADYKPHPPPDSIQASSKHHPFKHPSPKSKQRRSAFTSVSIVQAWVLQGKFCIACLLE